MPSPHTSKTLVTVIVPTIGRPEFIVDTLRSVLAQTYSELQILVSDNAPKVPTAALLATAGIEDTRIEIVQRATRLGFSAHMNACIAQARGTYLMIVSDDDQIAPEYVAEMMEVMNSDLKVKICLGKQIQIDEHRRGLVTQPGVVQPRRIINGLDFITGTLKRNLDTGVLTYISMFVRRSEILAVGGFKDYPDGSHADNFILFSLAMTGRVALLSSPMYYRVYLESSGLRTPFSALLEATKAYTRDACFTLQRTSIGRHDRRALGGLIKAANTRMLLNRIRDVYRHRLTMPALCVCVLRVLQFKLWRIPL